jgi:hypothetical protein
MGSNDVEQWRHRLPQLTSRRIQAREADLVFEKSRGSKKPDTQRRTCRPIRLLFLVGDVRHSSSKDSRGRKGASAPSRLGTIIE